MRGILFCFCLSLFLHSGAQQLDMFGLPSSLNSSNANIPLTKYGTQKRFTANTLRPLHELNDSTQADAYPWISGDGLRLYYTHSGVPSNNFMFTQRVNTSSLFNPIGIISLPIAVSMTNNNYWFSYDELDIYISNFSNMIFHAHRNNINASFGALDTIHLFNNSMPNSNIVFGISFDSLQNNLYIKTLSLNSIQVYSKITSLRYDLIDSINPPVNMIIGPGQLSKDDLTYYFSLSNTFQGTSALYQISRSSVLDTFDLTTLQIVPHVNLISNFVGQMTVSDSAKWAVFTRASMNSWTSNDLYMIHDGVLTSIFEKQEAELELSIYPNPSNGIFNIQLENSPMNLNKGSIEIYNQTGKSILNTALRKELDLRNYPKGIYLVKITIEEKSLTRKVLLR